MNSRWITSFYGGVARLQSTIPLLPRHCVKRQSRTRYRKEKNVPTGWQTKLWNEWENFCNCHEEWGHSETKVGRRLGGEPTYITRTEKPNVELSLAPSKEKHLRIVSCSGWENWGKVHWPLLGNQLISILAGGEEWEECSDVCRQTTALCLPRDAWYDGERVWGQPAGSSDTKTFGLCNKATLMKPTAAQPHS